MVLLVHNAVVIFLKILGFFNNERKQYIRRYKFKKGCFDVEKRNDVIKHKLGGVNKLIDFIIIKILDLRF